MFNTRFYVVFLFDAYIYIFLSQSAGCCFALAFLLPSLFKVFWSHNKQNFQIKDLFREKTTKSVSFLRGVGGRKKWVERTPRDKRDERTRQKANWKCVKRKKQKQSCTEQPGARTVADISYRLSISATKLKQVI